LDLDSVIYILIGSTFGIISRLFIKYKFQKKIVFYFNHTLIVNILSSLFLGILIGINPTNKNLLLLVSVGFLGCFSTFSSFIFELLNLIQKRKYIGLFIYYLEVFTLSFLFFCLGNSIKLIFKT